MNSRAFWGKFRESTKALGRGAVHKDQHQACPNDKFERCKRFAKGLSRQKPFRGSGSTGSTKFAGSSELGCALAENSLCRIISAQDLEGLFVVFDKRMLPGLASKLLHDPDMLLGQVALAQGHGRGKYFLSMLLATAPAALAPAWRAGPESAPTKQRSSTCSSIWDTTSALCSGAQA